MTLLKTQPHATSIFFPSEADFSPAVLPDADPDDSYKLLELGPELLSLFEDFQTGSGSGGGVVSLDLYRGLVDDDEEQGKWCVSRCYYHLLSFSLFMRVLHKVDTALIWIQQTQTQ